jgi:hypothetical protein
MSSESENVVHVIRVFVVGKRGCDFFGMLDSSGIRYIRKRPPIGVPIAGADTAVIAAAMIAGFAQIIAAWITSRPSRKATVTHIDRSITEITVVMNSNEIAKSLDTAFSVMVFDTNPTENQQDSQA